MDRRKSAKARHARKTWCADKKRRDRGDEHQADIERAEFAVVCRALSAQEDLPRTQEERRNDGCDVNLHGERGVQQWIEVHLRVGDLGCAELIAAPPVPPVCA